MSRRISFWLAVVLTVVVGTVEAAQFSINATKNRGGTIEPPGKVLVEEGASQDFTVSANDGFYLATLKVDGASVPLTDRSGTVYPFTNVTENHRIAARFRPNPTIVANANHGGSVEPAGKVPVAYGGSLSFSISPDLGFHVADVRLDGESLGAVTSTEVTDVIAKRRLLVKFAINRYTIATTAGSHGTIVPSNPTVKHGGKKVLTIVPDQGYGITGLTVDGVPVTGLPAKGRYKLKLEGITKDTAVVASFETGQGAKVEGLAVAGQVSVVDAKPPAQNAPPLQANSFKAMAAAAAPAVPEGSDYYTDKTHVYVHEKAGDALKTVNMILCMIKQTQYSDSRLINQGWYKALIDAGACEADDSTDNAASSSESGTTDSDAAPSFDSWTVKSERADESSPQLLSAYIHMGKGGPGDQPMTIHAKMTVTEGVSATNPLGIFGVDFKGLGDPKAPEPVMRGILKTELADGQLLIKFAEQAGPPQGEAMHVAKVAYRKDPAGDSGQGSALQEDQFGPFPQLDRIDFAYDANYFKRVDPSSGQGPCLDRTQFETSAWRYGLYDGTSGERVTLNGGFPISTSADGKGTDGYLGYYGLHLPPEAAPLDDGATVYRKSWDNGIGTTTPYTLVVRGGKLKKHVQEDMALGDIKNIPLEGNIPPPGESGPGSTMYRVTWDGTALVILASAPMGQDGPPAWTELSTPIPLDQTFVFPFTTLGLYSQALGGQLNIPLNNCAQIDPAQPFSGFRCDKPAADTAVVFYRVTTVAPGDPVPAVLSCYDHCPKAGPEGMDGSSPLSLTYPMDPEPGADNRHDYGYAELMLTDNGNEVVLKTAVPGQNWGFNSGPLFDASVPANLAALACDFDPAQICGWKSWMALAEFYTWETGPDSWNRLTAAKDQNDALVPFDQPLQVSFGYPETGTEGFNSAATDAKYGGTKFFLEYAGFGDLHGIPGKCVNPNDPTQAVADCSKPGLRWVPEFTIPTGSEALAGTDSLLIKPLEMEQRMSKSPGSCGHLNPVDMSASWPDLKQDWTDPALAEEPVITDPPKVIGGVIQ